MSEVSLFTWGYWGWGNATAQLVEAVDAVEASRGFKPPMFVDIRLFRKVRAVGFRDRAFEGLLGPSRYVWLDKLGNLDAQKKDRRGSRIPLRWRVSSIWQYSAGTRIAGCCSSARASGLGMKSTGIVIA